MSTSKTFLTSNRIPQDYFITSGSGESDISNYSCKHMALKDAKIEKCNIMTYSSILPKGANEVPFDESCIYHGQVLDCIMSQLNGTLGDTITAGIGYAYLTEKKSGKRFGGIVVENNLLNGSEDALKDILINSINEIYYNGFSEDYNMETFNYIMKTKTVTKLYGTVLCAICFISYKVKHYKEIISNIQK